MWTVVNIAMAAAVAMGCRTVLPQSEKPAPVSALGYFDATVSDGEHRTGYALRLWRSGGTVVGFFMVPQGPGGDPPTGLLENVSLGAKGEFSFTAKVPGGWKTPESRIIEEYQFNGMLERDTVKGTIQRRPGRANEVPSPERVTFKRSSEMSEIMTNYPTLSAWQELAARILKRRGPPQ